jgi:hypothetical protein
MNQPTHTHFSGHLCKTCGGAAPGWKCAECGKTAGAFDSRHALACPKGGRMEAECEKCRQAESKCTC